MVNDYEYYCNNNNIKLLNVENEEFIFKDQKLIKKRKYKNNYKDIDEKKYLNFFKKEYSNYDEVYIKNYFIKSGYKDNLILLLQITNDNFQKI